MKYGKSKVGAALLGDAAGSTEDEEESSEPSEEENSPDAERKRCFIDMAKAIAAKDWEKAWSAYQECEELG